MKKKVLVVESDAALAYLLTTTLEMQGYIIETVSSYDEIIPSLTKTMPDLLLLDAGDQSSEKGFAICRDIRNDDSFYNLKIIMSTIVHDKEKVLDAGADLYLPKPYELMTLFSWVNKLLSYDYQRI
ncbi:MAG: response regulator [Desulfosudis oleivorans]|nr:response regulator [Desulfosudis oleivorans]